MVPVLLLERLKGFFHFCVVREWMRTNPVHGIEPVKGPPSDGHPKRPQARGAHRIPRDAPLLPYGMEA